MDTVRRFTHPLTGDVHEQRLSAAAPARRGWPGYRAVALVVVAILAVSLLAVGCYAYKFYAGWSRAAAAIKAAQDTIVYEPLSKVDDGSYEELEGAADRRAVRVLRRLRRR